ncbi:7521_t:CDS:10 [Ambispora leptoticha]|uniref:7521_t:CDS:1 n=1 Tax=Ambispora leptoticha TaxID=144679 RepID=A0A9N8VB90_9GLOM|nr:7521_t:CDS:10 [Ambispora leptoticha]
MIADLANILDTQYLSNRDFSRWSHKDGYYALCRIERKAIHISTFEEIWKKSLATKKLSPQLVSLLKSRRKATAMDKSRLRKEFLDETAIDSLEEDAGATLLKSGMQYDTRRTKARLESGVKRRKRNDDVTDEEEYCEEEEPEEQFSDDAVEETQSQPQSRLENIRKWSFTATNDLHLLPFSYESSSSIILTMEKYCKKQTTSKFEDFKPEIWAELIADRPATAKPEYHKEIEFVCDHLFGPPNKKKRWKLNEYRKRWESLRNLEVPEYDDNTPYEKEDWKRIFYWADRAVGSFLDAFESEHNPIQQNDCGEREWFGGYIVPIFQGALKLNTFCHVPWGEVTVIATYRRKNHDKNALEYKLDRGHLADLLCKISQEEVVCALACGGPHKYDLTKWESDEYHLPRMLKDTLDNLLGNFRNRNRHTSDLYTIGIQQYMTEIRIYMMEKRDVYRLHLLKSFHLPLSHASYGNLRVALSWAWNIKGLVERLSFELEDEMIVSSKTPERDPPDEMKTDKTPERSKKKKV